MSFAICWVLSFGWLNVGSEHISRFYFFFWRSVAVYSNSAVNCSVFRIHLLKTCLWITNGSKILSWSHPQVCYFLAHSLIIGPSMDHCLVHACQGHSIVFNHTTLESHSNPFFSPHTRLIAALSRDLKDDFAPLVFLSKLFILFNCLGHSRCCCTLVTLHTLKSHRTHNA